MSSQGSAASPQGHKWFRRIIGAVLVIVGGIMLITGLSLSSTDARALVFSPQAILGGIIAAIGMIQCGGGFREVFRNLPQ